MKMTTDPIGLYVHIPFCLKKCVYCDFCSFPVNYVSRREDYIDALCEEIRSYKFNEVSIDSIFFGGGTPTLLSGEEFCKIVSAINESFNVLPNAEFTVEANPKTLNEENLRAYISCGVNRVSIGLQTIHENELKKLGRVHSLTDFSDTYSLVRRCGVKNVSVDLMYGIPEQTPDSFKETLDYVTKLSPEHISLYGLIIEDGTYLSDNLSQYRIPSEDEECDMYYLAAKLLADQGYSHYEISNYSKPNFSCKHNLKYWRSEEYIGVGVAAYSYFEGERYGNSREYDKYLLNFKECREFSEKIQGDSEKYEFAMLALRLSEGFSLSEYEERFGESFLTGRDEILDKLLKSNLLKVDSGRIYLTEEGFYVSNSILTELL